MSRATLYQWNRTIYDQMYHPSLVERIDEKINILYVLTVTVSDNFHPKLTHKVTLSIIEVPRSHNVKKYYHFHVKEAFICFSWLQFVFHRFFLIFLTRKLTCFASLARMIHIIRNGSCSEIRMSMTF